MIEVRFNYDYFGTHHSFKFPYLQRAVNRWSKDLATYAKPSSIETKEDLREALQKCVDNGHSPTGVRIEVLDV